MLCIHRSPRAVSVLAAAAVAVVGMSACGDDNKKADTAATTSAATPAVALPGSATKPATLVPGKRYAPTIFRPQMSFVLPKGGWSTAEPEGEKSLAIRLAAPDPTRNAIVAFVRVERVFDPKKGGRTAADGVPAPKDFVDWLAQHPRLKSEAPVPVELGGATGRQIDVTVRAAPQRCETPERTQAPCLRLYLNGNIPIEFLKGDRLRYVVLDVGVEPLIIEMYISPGKSFGTVLPALEGAIKQVRFGSG